MPYVDPITTALQQGGSTANQSASVASQFMRNSISSFNTAGSLSMKMVALLDQEEARKSQQLLQQTQLIHNIYQDNITNQMKQQQLNQTKSYQDNMVNLEQKRNNILKLNAENQAEELKMKIPLENEQLGIAKKRIKYLEDSVKQRNIANLMDLLKTYPPGSIEYNNISRQISELSNPNGIEPTTNGNVTTQPSVFNSQESVSKAPKKLSTNSNQTTDMQYNRWVQSNQQIKSSFTDTPAILAVNPLHTPFDNIRRYINPNNFNATTNYLFNNINKYVSNLYKSNPNKYRTYIKQLNNSAGLLANEIIKNPNDLALKSKYSAIKEILNNTSRGITDVTGNETFPVLGKDQTNEVDSLTNYFANRKVSSYMKIIFGNINVNALSNVKALNNILKQGLAKNDIVTTNYMKFLKLYEKYNIGNIQTHSLGGDNVEKLLGSSTVEATEDQANDDIIGIFAKLAGANREPRGGFNKQNYKKIGDFIKNNILKNNTVMEQMNAYLSHDRDPGGFFKNDTIEFRYKNKTYNIDAPAFIRAIVYMGIGNPDTFKTNAQ